MSVTVVMGSTLGAHRTIGMSQFVICLLVRACERVTNV